MLCMNKKTSVICSSIIYSTAIYKRAEVKSKRYFNQQTLKYRVELIVKSIASKYYKDLFFYLLFFLLFYFYFQYSHIIFTF